MNIDSFYRILRNLRTENGLYLASTGKFYRKVWIRDTFYCVLTELNENPEFYRQTYHTLLDYFIKMEKKYGKFTWLIKEPYPKYSFRYPHPRFSADLEEIPEPWGFKQLDCFGEFLFGVYLGEKNNISIIRNDNDRNIISLIIKMLESLQYWNDGDSGVWEENEEVHASSIGSCLAGLTAIRQLGFEVDQSLLDHAHETLNSLLPKESITKEVDLALLTLIYPFNIIDSHMARKIIHNVEEFLVRKKGVIRYKEDKYYNIANVEEALKHDRYYDPTAVGFDGNEAEWTFGFAFLSLCYLQLGDTDKAEYYLKKVAETEENGKIPELFYSNTNIANDNNPLGWSIAMAILGMKKDLLVAV